MPRTTDADVQAIIDVDATVAPSLAPFITPANMLVTEVCEEAGYDEDRLKEIETWLTAHFYAVRAPRKTSNTVDVLSSAYQSKVDLGFDVTHYGQMAMRLDTAGGLAALNAEQKSTGNAAIRPDIVPGMIWLGTSRDEYGRKVDAGL